MPSPGNPGHRPLCPQHGAEGVTRVGGTPIKVLVRLGWVLLGRGMSVTRCVPLSGVPMSVYPHCCPLPAVLSPRGLQGFGCPVPVSPRWGLFPLEPPTTLGTPKAKRPQGAGGAATSPGVPRETPLVLTAARYSAQRPFPGRGSPPRPCPFPPPLAPVPQSPPKRTL